MTRGSVAVRPRGYTYNISLFVLISGFRVQSLSKVGELIPSFELESLEFLCAVEHGVSPV